jgi:transcriptional regulator with XRE-family HTH domain
MSNTKFTKMHLHTGEVRHYNGGAMLETPASALEVAERLRSARLSLKLTQYRLCKIAGLSSQLWNNAETARARLGLDSAIRFCEVTGFTLDYIYRGVKTGLPMHLVEALSRVDPKRPDQNGTRLAVPGSSPEGR